MDDIRRWVEEDRSDEWIASALGTSPSSVQSFRSRHAIYRSTTTSTLYDPQDFSSYEGNLANNRATPAQSEGWQNAFAR